MCKVKLLPIGTRRGYQRLKASAVIRPANRYVEHASSCKFMKTPKSLSVQTHLNDLDWKEARERNDLSVDRTRDSNAN
ncbi:hypothetical protein AVEN_177037-1 [Araneus ventricosus]|uniref:Uncharacterized protein n=1 Tax=Araneus ventricosus TaxID=182803 RepID=A0A4Y2CRH2_ARAVE|nr:hypothetical protein AVEN_177037-1 [Araneus ventricosus]